LEDYISLFYSFYNTKVKQLCLNLKKKKLYLNYFHKYKQAVEEKKISREKCEKMHTKISIIILNWNTKELLKNCIESINKHINIDKVSYEIIVVDNGSSDGSAQMIKTCFLYVKLIENNENLGFSRGNNVGTRQATGRYLLFLNSDTLFIKETNIQYLIDKMEQNKQIGICACQLLNQDGSVQKSVRNFPYPLGIFFHYIGISKMFKDVHFFNKYLLLDWKHNQEKNVNQPAGAFLLIRSQLFKQIGGFDERFFIYYDDVDLCKKVILENKKILFSPKSKVIHLGGKSSEQVLGNNFFERNKNLILYYRKYHSNTEVLILKLVLFLVASIRSIDWLLRSIIKRNYFYIFKESVYFLIKIWHL